jgi:hypothetical protein
MKATHTAISPKAIFFNQFTTPMNKKNIKRKQVTSLQLDVCGSVHHDTIHTEKSNKMQQCIKIYYSIFI